MINFSYVRKPDCERGKGLRDWWVGNALAWRLSAASIAVFSRSACKRSIEGEGYEFHLLAMAMAASLVWSGGGRASFDGWLSRRLGRAR